MKPEQTQHAVNEVGCSPTGGGVPTVLDIAESPEPMGPRSERRRKTREEKKALKRPRKVLTRTSIEWTDLTLNPVTGCSWASPGCDHCYACSFAERFRGVRGHHFEQGFDIRLWPERLETLRAITKPKRIFVNSMSDLFHKDVAETYVHRVLEELGKYPHLFFQILTKRSSRLLEMDPKITWPVNVAMGVSVESQDFTYRISQLQRTRARVKFFSLEPLLGPLPGLDLTGIDQVIVGGESGPGARPMHVDWVHELRDQALAAGIPFFFKQWGQWVHESHAGHIDPMKLERAKTHAWPDGTVSYRVGKKLAGSLLDGRTWKQDATLWEQMMHPVAA